MSKNIEEILFLDIETVSKYETFKEFSENEKKMSEIWKIKSRKFYDEYFDSDNIDEEVYKNKSSLYPEFSKILSVAIGYVKNNERKIKVIFNDDEVSLLVELKKILDKCDRVLFGHNIFSFDIPFMCKRFLYNSIEIPNIINFFGKKPWEINHIDTLKLTQFGSYEMVSLELLCLSCGLNSPKTDILVGSNVRNIYFEKTKEECKKDMLEYGKNEINSLIDLFQYIKENKVI